MIKFKENKTKKVIESLPVNSFFTVVHPSKANRLYLKLTEGCILIDTTTNSALPSDIHIGKEVWEVKIYDLSITIQEV